MERQLLVTTKLEHLRKNNPVSFEELKIGSKIKTSVAAIKPNGLTVVIDGDMKGIYFVFNAVVI